MTDPLHPQPATSDASSTEAPVATPAASPSEREKVTFFNIPLPGFVSNGIHAVQDRVAAMRRATITSLPDFVVNNSSNAIAVTQLTGEVLMFKSNNTTFVQPQHRGVQNWWRYLVEPPKAMFGSVFSKSGTSASLKDFARPSFYAQSWRNLFDLEAATKLDKIGGKPLINRWQARSGFAGLSTFTVAAMVPDAKDTPEDVEKMAVLAQRNPVGYVGERLRRAVWFPAETAIGFAQKLIPGEQKEESQLGKSKREFAALGLTMAGMFSVLTGFRNIGAIDPAISSKIASNQKYVRNKAHSIAGAITALGGINMLLAPDNDTGWGRFGAISMFRLWFLPKSIMSRYENKDPNAHYYFGGAATLQGMNALSVLIGGAEKRPDGSIVDHHAIRKEAKLKAKEELRRYREEKQQSDAPHAAPLTVVGQREAGSRLADMPEQAVHV